MDRKLPKIYVNNIDKDLTNNKTIFYSKASSLSRNKETNKKINVKKQINELFNAPNYVYKMEVIITKKDGSVIKKEIVGKENNNLLTIDNDLISIDNILKIKY